MRIGFVAPYPPMCGGTASKAYWACRALAHAGHEVWVVTDSSRVPSHSRCWLRKEDGRFLVGIDGPRDQVRVWDLAGEGDDVSSQVNRLASGALRLADSVGVDVLVAPALEPYGLASVLASSWSGVPFIAGYSRSERAFLLGDAVAGDAARRVLRSAAAVITPEPDALGLLGVELRRMVLAAAPAADPQIFRPDVLPLELGIELRALAREWAGVRPDGPPLPGVPLVGLAGKVGPYKATWDFLAALGELKRTGVEACVLAPVGGPELQDFFKAVNIYGLADRVWRLPYLPPWRMPEFLSACSLVICGGTLPGRSSIVTESLALGTYAIVSEELASHHPAELPASTARIVPRSAGRREVAGLLFDGLERARSRRISGWSLAGGATLEEVAQCFEEAISVAVNPRHAHAGGPASDLEAWMRRNLPVHRAVFPELYDAVVGRFSRGEILSWRTALQELLEKTSLRGSDEPVRLQKLLEYERLLAWARTDLADLDDASPTSLEPPSHVPHWSEATLGRWRSWLRVLQADFDVRREQHTARGETPPSRASIERRLARVATRDYNLIVVRRRDYLPTQLEVSSELRGALDRWDGGGSWPDIRRDITPEHRASADAALAVLAREGALN